MVVEKFILKLQNAFVRGEKILDSILIAKECLNSRLRFGRHGVLCKMDIKMAYGHVSLEFL